MTMLALFTGTDNPVEEGHQENVGECIIHHVKNSNEWNVFGYHMQLPQFEPVNILGVSVDFSITNHVVMLWIASLILVLLFWLSFRKRTLVPKGFAAILEMLLLFLRDEVAIANLGEKIDMP